MAASCTTHLLPSGLIQANVTVKNTTSATTGASVYGPALRQVQYVHPVLQTVEVIVHVGKSAQSFPGWRLPALAPDKEGRVIFRMRKPAQALSILAAPGTSVKLDSANGLNNSDCTVG